MKIGQTAKIIKETIFPHGRHRNNNQPEYFGMCTVWNDNTDRWDKVDSTFIARKYSQIVDLVTENKAMVKIDGQTLHINSGSFNATIAIDELVTKILIPELSAYIVTD